MRIGFVGDVMIGRLVNENLSHVPPDYLWGDTLPLLKETDLNIINLEAALTTSEEAVPKVFNFKADPSKVQVLVEASVDVVNLANNHILDYSEEGLEETLRTLDNTKILHVGAGNTLEEARKAAILQKKGVKVGVLGCTDNEPEWLATESKPGVHYVHVGDFKRIKEDIEKLRPHVDILVLSMHWGPNMREKPTPQFVQFAHRLIECGVDIIHGHSAHIFQGVEIYKEKLILYDTGDFVDDYYVDPFLRNDRSFFFSVDVNKEGVQSLCLTPTLISNFQVNLAQGKEAEETLVRMQMLSKELNTSLTLKDGKLVVSEKN